MTTTLLTRHPDTPCEAVRSIAVEAVRAPGGRLSLLYIAAGDAEDLYLPDPAPPVRTDELWKRTCFEAFILGDDGAAYHEFNFSPSTAWAAYRFTGRREGMTGAQEIGDPRIEAGPMLNGYALAAELDLSASPILAPDGPWRLAITAVIEELYGRISYWSLAHPSGKPDFHSPEGFVLNLPAPE